MANFRGPSGGLLLVTWPPRRWNHAQKDVALATLQPTGLDIVTAAFDTEVGNAARMVTTADGEFPKVLGGVVAPNGLTALDVVHSIGGVGGELGKILQDKAVAEVALKEAAVSLAVVRQRSQAWEVTVQTALNILERCGAPTSTVNQLVAPVHEAVENARARRLANRAAKKKAAADKAAKEKAAAEKAAADKAAAEKAAGATGLSGATGATGASGATGATAATGPIGPNASP